MLVWYGYKDGSGEWFICIDTDKCTGCGECVKACSVQQLELCIDEFDPFREGLVVRVKDNMRNKIRYSCAACRPGYEENPPPCSAVCARNAISHSEAWRG